MVKVLWQVLVLNPLCVQNNGEKVGAFEIVQINKKENKNIIKTVLEFISSKETVEKTKLAYEFITTIIGIRKSLSATFLKIPYFLLFFIICLFD